MGPMNYEVRAFSWEDINNYFDQIVEMQRENIYEFHYPEKEPKIEYIVAKLRELENYLNKGNSHFKCREEGFTYAPLRFGCRSHDK
jgi:Zn-dependent oligopeptidase